MKYHRILLKLSGESLAAEEKHGINQEQLLAYCSQIIDIAKQGIQVAIVIGGGNIFRGLSGVDKGFDRVKGDQMGMLATIINSLALQSQFESLGQKARVFTSIGMEPVGKRYDRDAAVQALENGEVVMIAGGTGNPFFTTDSAAALRGVEIGADILFKGTRVDGVYTADPEKDPTATRFSKISFDEVISKKLKIMDQTAFALCSENHLPILVFDMNKVGNLQKAISGEDVGTVVA